MRSQEEILRKMDEVKDEDFFGFMIQDLILVLNYKNAKQFLNEGVTEKEWGESISEIEKPKSQIKNYMEFAWGKANNCRGISAHRSIQHFLIWTWLDCEDELYKKIKKEFIENYCYYGKPILEMICDHYKIDYKKYDDGKRSNTEY